MKQLFLIFILFLFVPLANSQESAELILKLKKGDNYLIEVFSTSKVTQDIMGEQRIVKKDNFISYNFKVIDIPSDSTYYIKTLYNRIKTTVELQNSINTFDTDSTSSGESVFSLINNNCIYYEISQKGEILKIDSLDNMLNVDSVQNINSGTKDLLKNLFRKETIKNSSFIIRFPDKKLPEKESWSYTDTTKENVFYITDLKNTLNKINDTTYQLINSANLYADKNETLSINGAFISYDMKGVSKGYGVLNKSSCMLKESKTLQNIEGTVNMMFSADSDPAYTWPIIIKNTVSVIVTKIKE